MKSVLVRGSKFSLISALLISVVASFAEAKSLQCWSNRANRALPVMNDQVVQWKQTSKNQYKDRALVSGVVTRVTLMRNSHRQFEIKIGDQNHATIEVIYNNEFGELPTIRPGMQVEACGDYITAREAAGGYQPSPSGAIIHWVHFNPGDRDGGRHEDGYVKIDGVTYGQTYMRGGNGKQQRGFQQLMPSFELAVPAFAQ